MIRIKKQQQIALMIAASSKLACPAARADAVCDLNIKVGEIDPALDSLESVTRHG